MTDWLPLPIKRQQLERFRVDARRLQSRMNLVGGHIRQRMGQSLEFREFTRYNMGDDIRHVDWRASLRTATDDDWLVRRFASEEHLKLLISVDTRETMYYPQTANGSPTLAKIQLARWLTEALTLVSLNSDDRVTLHNLFGTGREMRTLRGSGSSSRIKRELDILTDNPASGELLNDKNLNRVLPPSAVWVIITDLYFDTDSTQANRLLRRIVDAQRGLRWVMVIELNSWAYERNLIGEGALRVEGPGTNRRRVHMTHPEIVRIEERIATNRQRFLDKSGINQKNDYVPWVLPIELDTPEDLAAYFRAAFIDSVPLKRLFVRDK